ncbi:cysteine proteinase [Massarina eburnea CBS 473.64]|uniref:Cysteine proteinase n=1 Tax=Massarina eburnea CBS 473.64 TaxID=1395130 RepID=A0A6A6S727_9PLEO|nr:cysteine proteinase [Massarina eburnea CBS 473.64]
MSPQQQQQQQRSGYTKAQISEYFDRLRLPEERRRYDVAGLEPGDALEYLGTLQRLHLAEIPFENLTLHYSPHRQICIHAEELFTKIIGDGNGRGGYCMENNGLFGTLLYCQHRQDWRDEVRVVPMPLDRSGAIQKHMQPGAARLEWQNIAGNTDPDQRLWVYHYRRDERSDFETVYCFSELEFLPSDYQIMNYYTSTSMRIFFTRIVVMEKKLLADGELVGSLTMNQNTLKWRVHGTKEREIKFESEADRIRALEEHFGILLTTTQRDGIEGLPSEIQNGGGA